MLRKILVVLLVMAFVPAVYAGTTGKIAGQIKDKNTGEPLPGVNVVVEGQSLGASTDIDGMYYIINIPVGEQNIEVTYVGFRTIKMEGVKIYPDRTTQLDFELEETVIDVGEVIVVEAERERIQQDLTMSSQYVSGDDIIMLPVEDFEAAARLQAGAVGSNFRGGRASEASPFIDGVNIKDPSAGYDDIQNNDQVQTSFVLPEVSIEELEVITGGFNAEYGNAQSAIINVITKDGGSKHSGRLAVKTAFATDAGTRYLFKDQNGDFVYERDRHLKEFFDSAVPSDSLVALGVRGPSINEFGELKIDDYQRNEYEFSLNGPIPFAGDALRYSINGEIVDSDRQQMSYWGPTTQGAFQGKITYRISPEYKLQFIGLGSWVDGKAVGFIDSKYPGGYMPGYGVLPAKPETEEYTYNRNYMGSIKWTHTLSPNTFYEVQASYNQNTFEQKTKDWNDRDGDGDVDEFFEWKYIDVPVDPSDPNTSFTKDLRYTSDDTKFYWVGADSTAGWGGGWKFGVPGKSDFREVWVLDKTNYTYSKVYRFLTGTQNERELSSYPIAEENEGSLYPTVPNAYFDYYGDGASYFDTKSTVMNVKADFTSQVTPQHLVKAGVSFEQTDFEMLNVGFFSVSNLYIDEFKVKPWDFNAYVQDKMEFEGMIVNAGIRLDYFNPGNDITYPGDFTDPVNLTLKPGDPGYVLDEQTADPFLFVSPRLGISHPITENTVLHYSYGHFYQRPDYRYWFENGGYNFQGAYVEMGNPSLEPEKTVAYEVGVQHNVGDYRIGVNAFYKDITNLIDQVQAGEAPFSDYWIYDNRDWADTRGFELKVKKYYSDYFAGEINYTYMIAKGKASSTQAGGSELWRKLAGVTEDYYLDWDQRHTINANVTLSVPNNWGPEVGGYYPLGNWSFNVLYQYGSAKPYTPPTRDPQPEYNTRRLVSTMTTDIKLEKRFTIGDNMRALLFVEGYNIFNRKNLTNFDGQLTNLDDVSWYEDTGSYEGRNLKPFVWGPRRNFRVGLGFEF